MNLTILYFIVGVCVGVIGCVVFEIILLIYIAKKFQPAVVERTVGKIKETLQ